MMAIQTKSTRDVLFKSTFWDSNCLKYLENECVFWRIKIPQPILLVYGEVELVGLTETEGIYS
jgi:hypothetical protein